MSKSAIVLGATGLTGSLLLKELLADEYYSKVILFSRSSARIKHAKIEEHLIDVLNLCDHKEKFKADVVFCCIGTTKKKTPDQNMYQKIDVGIPHAAALVAKENDIPRFIVISAMGANTKSSIFYNRIKGEMEEKVLKQQVKYTYILRPSLITGVRSERRTGEKLAIYLFKVLDYLMLGPLKKYQSISAKEIVNAMLILSQSNRGSALINSAEIKNLSKKIGD